MLDVLKPYLRAFKYSWLKWSAEQKIHRRGIGSHEDTKPMAFIISCGRSGTTILGKLFSYHPQISYLFEPYHLWAAVDRKTDVLNLFHQVDASLFMTTSDCNQQSQYRFNRLIRSSSKNNQAKLVIEKTPLNALRIGYIEALAPNSKFVHIVRDGVDVCHSINKLASTNSYKITGKPALNQWWGVDYAKWKALLRDGANAGYYVNEVNYLNNHLSRAAYEWLVSLDEIDRWRETLGDRLKEVTYDALITDPKSTLKELCDFLEIDSSQSWLDKAVSVIYPPVHQQEITLSLPPAMCKTFNSYQKRYQFLNRAVCLKES